MTKKTRNPMGVKKNVSTKLRADLEGLPQGDVAFRGKLGRLGEPLNGKVDLAFSGGEFRLNSTFLRGAEMNGCAA